MRDAALGIKEKRGQYSMHYDPENHRPERGLGGRATKETNRQIRRVTIVGMAANVGLAVLKILAGVYANSQAVVADGVHSLSDLVTDAVVLIGVKYWNAPADDKHPHGHRRIETMITVGIGLSLTLVAFEMGYEALNSMRGNGAVSPPGWAAFWAAIASILVKEVLYRWTSVVGNRVKSSAVVANAWHHRSDALSSIPAAGAVCIAALYPEWVFVDSVGAILVSLLVLQAAWKIAKPAILQLLDHGAPPEVVENIRQLAEGTTGVEGAHAIRTRYQGNALQVDLHVLVDPDITVRDGHTIAEKVNVRLRELGPDVQDVVVHVEPFGEHDDGY